METAWLTRGTEYPFRCFEVWLISTTMCWWRRPLKIPNNAYYVQSLTGGFDRARRGKWMMHFKLEVWEKKTELPEAIQRWMHQLCNYSTCSICFQNFPLYLHLSFAIYSLFLSQDWPPRDRLLDGQSWGGQSWVYQSPGLSTSTIMYYKSRSPGAFLSTESADSALQRL